jgi:SAM-dependent methyltransferase
MTETIPRIDARIPVGLDPDRPSLARVYNRLLGGKDNYLADHHAIEQLEEAAPGQCAAARRSREFQQRVLRYLASSARISQFLDLGAGLPSPDVMPDTHEVLQFDARGEADRATVVYVDRDPVCVAHGRALMEVNGQTHYLLGDLTDPSLLHDPATSTYLDLTKPMGVLLCGVLHHLDDAASVVRGWVDVLPAGSFMAITHLHDPGPADPLHRYAAACQDRYRQEFESGWFRTREQITALFDGLEMVAPAPGIDPGLVAPDEWWPYGPPVRFKSVAERLLLAGVGWKPGTPPVGNAQ